MKLLLSAAAFSMALGSSAFAATIDFEGLSGDPLTDGIYQFTTDQNSGNPQINSGNCLDGMCLGVRPNGDGEIVTMTRVDGGAFDLTSMWFQLLGVAHDNTLKVMAAFAAGGADYSNEFAASNYPNNNGGQTFSFGADLSNVSFVTFQNLNKGSVRIDDLVVGDEDTVIPAPLPAGLPMLVGGLGLLTFLRRKTKG